MAKGVEVNRRHEAILEILSSEGSMSKSQLVEQLRRRDEGIGFAMPGDDLSAVELEKFNEAQEVKAARALKDMKSAGLVSLDEVSARKFRKPGDMKTQFWMAKNQLEPDLDEIAALIALDTIMDSLQWLIPEEIRSDLERARERARSSVGKMPVHSPEKRWLAALRVLSPYPTFEKPLYDDEVRCNIETAIKQKKRVDITYRLSNGDVCEAVASITDWIVRLPDTISVVSWEHLPTDGDVESEMFMGVFEIPLAWIERVCVREDAAYEPTANDRKHHLIIGPEHGGYSLDSLRDNTLSRWGDPLRDTYEFRASPSQMQRWRSLWIGSQLKILGIDEDGWSVCRYSAKGRRGFIKHLISLRGEVEVLSPYAVRTVLKGIADDMAAMYSVGQQLPPDMVLELEDKYILGSSTEGGYMLQWESLDTLDERVLADSEMWQREPDLIEILCVGLSLHDPKWLMMSDVQRSNTEYLAEAERIAGRMPALRSVKELAGVLASEFHEAEKSKNFEGFDMPLYWQGMAEMIWPDTARWRSGKRYRSVKA